VRFGLLVANIGTYADPRAVVRIAQAAERSGWDALLVWDHLGFVWDGPSADPWVTLGAVAVSTERLLLGTGVTPVPRRRPHVLAHEVATLERLSRGRAVLGVGLGGNPAEFGAFGEPTDAAERAELLDESLALIRALLDGEQVEHDGPHYRAAGVTLSSPPERRIPIWVGGTSAAALRRAARYDAWFADTADAERMTVPPDELRARLAAIARPPPIDVAVVGYSTAGDAALHEAYAAAGVTWWMEQLHDRRGDASELLARIEAGP